MPDRLGHVNTLPGKRELQYQSFLVSGVKEEKAKVLLFALSPILSQVMGVCSPVFQSSHTRYTRDVIQIASLAALNASLKLIYCKGLSVIQCNVCFVQLVFIFNTMSPSHGASKTLPIADAVLRQQNNVSLCPLLHTRHHFDWLLPVNVKTVTAVNTYASSTQYVYLHC